MAKRIIAVITATILVTAFMIPLSTSISFAEDNKTMKRVLAHTEKKVDDAIKKGCKVVRDGRTFKAMLCAKIVADSLGLQEDIKVFAIGSGANRQIGASIVHAAGNDGSGRKVAVLDTGMDYTHPELSSSYLGGKDFVNNDNDPMDDNGHGTHVASTITGDGIVPKAKGVAPGAGIIVGKVLDESGSGYFSNVVAGIYWAVDGPDGIYGTADDFGVDAINLSLGTAPPYTYKSTYCNSVFPDLAAAINYARSKGVVVVVAAGNNGISGVSAPGCIKGSITVGAVDYLDKVASFSGRGKALDIVAPGVNIYAAWLANSYLRLSGTSMATPMVTGTVALIKHAHPTWSVTDVENALLKTAKDLGKVGWDGAYGNGRVNATSAVNYIP